MAARQGSSARLVLFEICTRVLNALGVEALGR
jgi:hypothetical protein